MTLDEAIKQCDEIADYDCYNEKQMKRAEEYRQLAEWLKDYKRLLKKGKWVEPYIYYNGLYKCDQCGHEKTETSNFCPHCGADMRGNKNEIYN